MTQSSKYLDLIFSLECSKEPNFLYINEEYISSKHNTKMNAIPNWLFGSISRLEQEYEVLEYKYDRATKKRQIFEWIKTLALPLICIIMLIFLFVFCLCAYCRFYSFLNRLVETEIESNQTNNRPKSNRLDQIGIKHV